ncbi:DUF4259 domain-containing protein [Cellulomonas sp. S1-8]|uniref:DUF4259 domain-containing protein n=1 Tax=Cellulomonas sp. S1-8 TaxID=2904790 RepID=UPI002243DBC2|nr:DUF4259 domain-containing protein [Cellulomonas sp. S1-8]UZN03803.1 DUF4259 domain-containing protein [Cellulomonas sp. S1-8]
MGTWGLGPFDNDTAADWAAGLDEAAPQQRESVVREALTSAIEAEDDLDGDDGMVAIAAAAVVASRLPGGPEIDHNYGPDVATVTNLRPDADLRALAARALERTCAEGSEWRELWEEADEYDNVVQALAPIAAALREGGDETSAKQARWRDRTGRG